MSITVLQLLPELNSGGVESGTLEIASELVRRNHRSIVMSAGGRLEKKLIASGSEHVNVNIGKKSFFTLRHIPFLRRYFSTQKIDIVHARSRFPAWIAYLAWKSMPKDSRPYFITTVHGHYQINAYSKIMTKGQSVVAVSKCIENYIQRNYPDTKAEKIVLIQRGISEKQFPFMYTPTHEWLNHWQQQHPQLHNKFIVTLPARISESKGQKDFIQIIAKVIKANIPIHALIVGEASHHKRQLLKQLKESITALGLNNHISLLGYRHDIREIMAVSNIVLSLSKIPEAFGRTTLEALSLGTPVIGYSHGGTQEILSTIFPQGQVFTHDMAAICAKIIAFYNTPPKLSKQNIFTLETMLHKKIELYGTSIEKVKIYKDDLIVNS